MRRSPPAPIASALYECLVHRFAAMGEVREMQRVMHFALLSGFHTGQGDSGSFAAGVQLQHDWLECALLLRTIFEPDRERDAMMDHCPFAHEQQPRSLF